MRLAHVMLVDDSEADQFLATLVLKEYNPDIEILQAYDGLEALEILDQTEREPELIFLDINMPRMDGHEFLEVYSKRGGAAAVVVMLTSSVQEEDRTRSAAFACVKKYQVKPMEVEDLLALAD